ncbi:phosphatase PAP2 family protein [Noviherbaspirillum saxi]|uniref:Acid phosphatase n=2 Tax=Noviherbaspirillum saxi TaxID=2320863 RepID=A0A3A3FLE8_9BURK|nr:phosphatase PAP2 family protein [Noviherbaspirillum saxi]
MLAVGCSSIPVPPTSPAEVKEVRPGYLAGYLARKDLPDSLTLLPSPPAAGSAVSAADEEAYRTTRSARGTLRWQLAAQDAILSFPKAAEAFSCTLGMPISQEATPHLNMLMRRSLADAGLATYAAKDKYQRTRPFIVHKEESCTPKEEAHLSKDGSYPSGHAALGWAWALILAEIAPERVNALLARGHDFGQSRVICGVHWQSDVDAGRVVGAAAVARLHADPMFQAQLAAAKAEVESARIRGVKPVSDCKSDATGVATVSHRQ